MDFFNGQNSYDTPADKQRAFIDKLFLGSSTYFMYRFLKQVLHASSLSKKGKYDKLAWEKSSFDTLKYIESSGGKVHINNLHNLKKCDGPLLFVSNHMSTLEPFLLPCLISPIHKVTFVVKASLVTHPFFAPIMKSIDAIGVGRQNPREDFQIIMKKGQAKLSEGTSVAIFPQSTRTTEFIPENFNSMGVKLAKAAGVKVIPIAVKTDFWGNGKILKDFGRIHRELPVHVNFGEPMEITGNGKAEHKEIVNFIQTNLNNWSTNKSE